MGSNKELLTTGQAATVIGCSIQHVRTLINRKKLLATSVKTVNGSSTGMEWRISMDEAKRYRAYQPKKGWKRGQKRK